MDDPLKVSSFADRGPTTCPVCGSKRCRSLTQEAVPKDTGHERLIEAYCPECVKVVTLRRGERECIHHPYAAHVKVIPMAGDWTEKAVEARREKASAEQKS